MEISKEIIKKRACKWDWLSNELTDSVQKEISWRGLFDSHKFMIISFTSGFYLKFIFEK